MNRLSRRAAAPKPPLGAAAPRRRPRGRFLAAVATGLLVTAVLVAWWAIRVGGPTTGEDTDVGQLAAAEWQRPAVGASDLTERTGVQLVRVAVSGAGGLIDVRFKVVDPELADAVHDPATPPAIVDEATGLVVHDLLMGHSHSQPFKSGVTYYLVLENSAGWVHRGSKVSVLLGNAQVEHVVVS